MISIIVPIYNVEDYIETCIDSIVKQTYRDLQIILVDDGSTDKSGDKCDEWAKHDDRIVVFHKSNGGLMSAWKYGVEKSSGDYIGFVDGDDWIDTNMYEVLLERIEAEQADLVLCGFVKDFADGRSSQNESILLRQTVYDRADIANKIYPIAICSGQSVARGISPNRVTKLYKRQLIVDVMNDCPDEVSIGEDLVSTTAAITKCGKLCVIHDFFPYHYRINNASMVQNYSDAKYEKIKKLNKALVMINVKNGMLFTDQIANDYIKVVLETMEQEILQSGYSNNRLKADIKRELQSGLFVDSLKKANKKRFSLKTRIYLILNKLRWWDGIILLRKLV